MKYQYNEKHTTLLKEIKSTNKRKDYDVHGLKELTVKMVMDLEKDK